MHWNQSSLTRVGTVILLLTMLIAPVACQSTEIANVAPVRALIIGNDYVGTGYDLDNPVRDARLVATKLNQQGHEVRTVLNQTSSELESSLDQFISGIDENEIVFVYFSGHGLQENNENYLLTNDGGAISTRELIAALHDRATSIVTVLDACRTPPQLGSTTEGDALNTIDVVSLAKTRSIEIEGFAEIPKTISLDGSDGVGLSEMELDFRDVYVAFSTAPNRVAYDKPLKEGEVRSNSPFAIAFADSLELRRSFDEVMNATSETVMTLTNQRQVPWRQSSFSSELYLNGQPQVFDESSVQIPPL